MNFNKPEIGSLSNKVVVTYSEPSEAAIAVLLLYGFKLGDNTLMASFGQFIECKTQKHYEPNFKSYCLFRHDNPNRNLIMELSKEEFKSNMKQIAVNIAKVYDFDVRKRIIETKPFDIAVFPSVNTLYETEYVFNNDIYCNEFNKYYFAELDRRNLNLDIDSILFKNYSELSEELSNKSSKDYTDYIEYKYDKKIKQYKKEYKNRKMKNSDDYYFTNQIKQIQQFNNSTYSNMLKCDEYPSTNNNSVSSEGNNNIEHQDNNKDKKLNKNIEAIDNDNKVDFLIEKDNNNVNNIIDLDLADHNEDNTEVNASYKFRLITQLNLIILENLLKQNYNFNQLFDGTNENTYIEFDKDKENSLSLSKNNIISRSTLHYWVVQNFQLEQNVIELDEQLLTEIKSFLRYYG